MRVRMAEWSKALRSGRSLLLQAWVRIPLLTVPFCHRARDELVSYQHLFLNSNVKHTTLNNRSLCKNFHIHYLVLCCDSSTNERLYLTTCKKQTNLRNHSLVYIFRQLLCIISSSIYLASGLFILCVNDCIYFLLGVLCRKNVNNSFMSSHQYATPNKILRFKVIKGSVLTSDVFIYIIYSGRKDESQDGRVV